MKTLGRAVLTIALVALLVTYVHSEQKIVDPVYTAETKEKVAALTFDDGPHPVFTREILQELAQEHVHATFFMIGSRMEKYPDVVREVAMAGHAIGNHTYTHPYDLGRDNEKQVAVELEKTEALIERMTGRRTNLFRPPRGRRESRVMAVSEKEGYHTVLWTVCADNRTAPTPAAMARRVMQHLRPGAIILIHDGYAAPRVRDVVATSLIIRGLKERGYRLVTIPELLTLDQRAVKPH